MKKFSQFIQEANNSLSEFVDKNKNLAVFHAKRIRLPSGGRLIPNGHGDYHDSKTGEFIAKSKVTSGGTVALKFSNQNQRLGKRDPDQDRSKLSPLVPPSHQVSEEFEKQLRDKYIRKEIFNEGDWVENLNTGSIGKIIRRGTNYLICVTEDNVMFKPWIRDVVEVFQKEIPSKNLKHLVKKAVKRNDTNIDGFVDKEDDKAGPYGAFIPQLKNTPKNFRVNEWTDQSGVPANQREVGTDSLRKYVMSVSDTKTINNFNVKKFINKYKVKRT